MCDSFALNQTERAVEKCAVVGRHRVFLREALEVSRKAQSRSSQQGDGPWHSGWPWGLTTVNSSPSDLCPSDLCPSGLSPSDPWKGRNLMADICLAAEWGSQVRDEGAMVQEMDSLRCLAS